MVKLSLSPAEAFALLLASESFLPESPESLSEALASAKGKLAHTGAASPFTSAAEALKGGFQAF